MTTNSDLQNSWLVNAHSPRPETHFRNILVEKAQTTKSDPPRLVVRIPAPIDPTRHRLFVLGEKLVEEYNIKAGGTLSGVLYPYRRGKHLSLGISRRKRHEDDTSFTPAPKDHG